MNTSIKMIKYNLKIIMSFNIIIAAVFALLAPVIFSLKFLDFRAIANIAEFYLSITGIILIPCLANIEDRNNIKEVVFSRETSHALVTGIRLAAVMLLMFIIIMTVLISAKLQGSNFSIWYIGFGTWISAAFLGMLGFTVANLSSNISAAYLISFSYYVMEFFTSGKYTKDLYLFSLTKGYFQNGKYILLVFVILMIIFNLLAANRNKI